MRDDLGRALEAYVAEVRPEDEVRVHSTETVFR
jgi:hypothetical protein